MIRQSLISRLQATYYFLTGIWPVIHIRSFLEISGPKTDEWLVKMVALLTVSIAISLFYAASNHLKTALVLGIFAAASYIFVDVTYAMRNTIPKIYLADAVVEACIIIMLIFSKRDR